MTTPINPPGPFPRGPSQKYPGSAQPITTDPKSVDQGHANSDLDSSKLAQHHTLGYTPNQASPGNHNHDGSTSVQFQDLELLGNLAVDLDALVNGRLTVDGVLDLAGMQFGLVTITPSAANTPTGAVVTYPAMPGTQFFGFATASTSVPGTGVTGVGVTNPTATSMNVILTRTNTTPTGVYWLVLSFG